MELPLAVMYTNRIYLLSSLVQSQYRESSYALVRSFAYWFRKPEFDTLVAGETALIVATRRQDEQRFRFIIITLIMLPHSIAPIMKHETHATEQVQSR